MMYKKSSKIFWIVLMLALAILSGCGKKETTSMPVQNHALVSLDDVDLSEFTSDKKDETTAVDTRNWSPRGNYTFVLASPGPKGIMSALVRVDSVDFPAGEANVSYVLAYDSDKAVNSNGLVCCPMTVKENADGSKEIGINIAGVMYLEFTGTYSSNKGTVTIDSVRYNLKSEG